MISTVRIIELVVFYILSLSVGYLFLFAIASKFYRRRKYAQAEKMNRFAVLFPAYKEDKVIIQSVTSFLEQDYPKDARIWQFMSCMRIFSTQCTGYEKLIK